MAFENFKPTIWSTSILMKYQPELVLAALCNRQYEGEIRNGGESVKINEVADFEVRDYAGSVTYDKAKDASKMLTIDKKKYSAHTVDSVDAVQANVSLLELTTQGIGRAIAKYVDGDIASLHGEAGITEGLGTDASPISITSANVTNYLADVATKMDENNVPEDGRVAVVPPWFAHKLSLAKITKDTDNSEALASGYVGTYYGFDIYKSNQIKHSGSTWYKPMFFLAGSTIAYAEQLMLPEAMRSQDSFGDNLRTLIVYGRKVVRPEALAVLTCASGAES